MIPELGAVLFGAFFTLAVFSYLLGDNPLFRLALNVFIGVTAGYLVYIDFKMVLGPWTVQRLVLGTWGERGLALVPLFFGVMYWLKPTGIFTPHLARLSRVVLAFFIGVGSAVAVAGALTGTLLPQAWGLMQTFGRATLVLEARRGWLPLIGYIGNGGMVLLGALATLLSFHYGSPGPTEQAVTARRAMTWVRGIGKFFVAVALGVIFAGVFQAGLTALVERVQTLSALLAGLAWPK